jgi:hypothetical protein
LAAVPFWQRGPGYILCFPQRKFLNTLSGRGGRFGGGTPLRRDRGPIDHIGDHRPTMPMSGCIAQHFTSHEIRDRYDLVGGARTIEPRYNITPTGTIEVVVVPWAIGTTIIPPVAVTSSQSFAFQVAAVQVPKS